MDAKPELRVTVFSDYICPFCYIGDARLDRLRADYDLKINWCFLEIHPETPATGRPVSELGYAPAQWTQMMANLARLAREEGLVIAEHDFTTNSRKALLLAEAAKRLGRKAFYALHRRLFEAFFRDQINIGDAAVLRALVRELGLDDGLCDEAWHDPQFEQNLNQYMLAARELGVRATPTIFIGQQRFDGAVDAALLAAAARQTLETPDISPQP